MASCTTRVRSWEGVRVSKSEKYCLSRSERRAALAAANVLEFWSVVLVCSSVMAAEAVVSAMVGSVVVVVVVSLDSLY